MTLVKFNDSECQMHSEIKGSRKLILTYYHYIVPLAYCSHWTFRGQKWASCSGFFSLKSIVPRAWHVS